MIWPFRSLKNGEYPVQPTQSCEFCGSGVLKVVVTKDGCSLHCMQCFSLNLPLPINKAKAIIKKHAWMPAESGRNGL